MPQPQHNPQRQQQSAPQLPVNQQQVQQAIREGGKPLVDAAEKLGKHLVSRELTTSQIRNIYGMVKRMEMRGFDVHEFVLLKPKLAYTAKRARDRGGAEDLKTVLIWAIDEVGSDASKFQRFVDFFEAILAYHKAEGGKER